ncbi:hypothetical protein ACW9YV_15650 (plasmid) [Paraburkholderia strydomiana]
MYLAVLLDLYSRKVIGEAMTPTMPAVPVVSALTIVLQQRWPAPGLVLHSDWAVNMRVTSTKPC